MKLSVKIFEFEEKPYLPCRYLALVFYCIVNFCLVSGSIAMCHQRRLLSFDARVRIISIETMKVSLNLLIFYPIKLIKNNQFLRI